MKKQAKRQGRKPQRKKAPSPVQKSTRREPPPPNEYAAQRVRTLDQGAPMLDAPEPSDNGSEE